MSMTWDDFAKIDLRAGTITKAEIFTQAHRPAYKLWIDLGPELGIKKSSAQITNYAIEDLINQQVLCVVNLGAKQVANFMSEVLVTGFVLPDQTILSLPQANVPNGTRLS